MDRAGLTRAILERVAGARPHPRAPELIFLTDPAWGEAERAQLTALLA